MKQLEQLVIGRKKTLHLEKRDLFLRIKGKNYFQEIILYLKTQN